MARDRRGYETTSLVEAGGRRRKGQRLLYFFRTPPSVRVGREAIDPEAMRLLEEHNPDVSFDWERLLKSGSLGSSGSSGSFGSGSGSGPGSREERRRERRDQRLQRRGEPRPPFVPEAGATPAPPAEVPDDFGDAARFERAEPATTEQEPVEPESVEPEAVEPEPVEPGTPNPQNLQNPEPEEPEEPEEPAEPLAPRYDRLGAEGLRRLRARYADLRSRIQAKTMDEAERTELIARLERLNPDAWHTDEDVAQGIDEYEVVFESFRGVVGRPPRRRRL